MICKLIPIANEYGIFDDAKIALEDDEHDEL
jgi:hypothetical protein